jgi:benzoate/toluate 1,2-dioxygenase alpha subunit
MIPAPFIIDDRANSTFRVRRATMIDPDILAQEQIAIFDSGWLYVGHDSELAQPNEFRARDVGGRPVIFVRDQHGDVRVFYNVCSHRGTTLCREAQGNSRVLTCFYHAWGYETTGDLVTIPGDEAYGPGFDRASLGLKSPPQVDSYRGFYFLTYSPSAPPLGEFLGDARSYLDLIVDQGIDGGMEVVRGSHEYTIGANWKLLVENSFDAYHVAPTHRRYLKMTSELGVPPLARAPGERAITAAVDLGHGHAAIATARDAFRLGRSVVGEQGERAAATFRSRLEAAYNPAWVERMYGIRNVVLYPNLVIIDLVGGIIIRTFYPAAVDQVRVTAWELAPRGEDPILRATRLDNFLTFWGPAGLATPDDVEALECIQRGFRAGEGASWSDVSRGMAAERSRHTDELQMRVFWRRWNQAMTGEIAAPEPHVVAAPLLAERTVSAVGGS